MADACEFSVPNVKLGSQGLEVSAQGLGCQGMAGNYGPPLADDEMVSLIHYAASRGVTFLDTADAYGASTNEIQVGKALKGIRESVQLATKFGLGRVGGQIIVRGDPGYVRAACEASLKRLDIDCIELYFQHRVHTTVPIEITVGEMKKLVEEGKVKYIGLSEASPETIRRAHAVHPITAVQIEWSLWSRDVEEQIIPTCRELGIGIVAYGPLGRGFLSYGPEIVETLANGDMRKAFPRFQADNIEKNKIAYERICDMASRKGCSPSQLALAWVHHQGNDVVPIPGTTKMKNLKDNIASLCIKLMPEEMSEIENTVASAGIVGDRYPESFMHTSWIFANTPPLSTWKQN